LAFEKLRGYQKAIAFADAVCTLGLLEVMRKAKARIRNG